MSTIKHVFIAYQFLEFRVTGSRLLQKMAYCCFNNLLDTYGTSRLSNFTTQPMKYEKIVRCWGTPLNYSLQDYNDFISYYRNKS